jgi:hypothetical protein
MYEFKTDDQGNERVVPWRKIEGRCWGMSDRLRLAKVYTVPVSYRIEDLIRMMDWEPTVRYVKKDHCDIYYGNIEKLLADFDPVLYNYYRSFYLKQYRQLYLRTDQAKAPPIIKLQPDLPPDPIKKVERVVQLRLAC